MSYDVSLRDRDGHKVGSLDRNYTYNVASMFQEAVGSTPTDWDGRTANPIVEAAIERLAAMAAMTTVDPTPLDPYGRCKATYGDFRTLLTDHATQAARIAELEGELALIRQMAAESVKWDEENLAAIPGERDSDAQFSVGQHWRARVKISRSWQAFCTDPIHHPGRKNLTLSATQPAAPSLPADVWQPIDTAPKDGTKFVSQDRVNYGEREFEGTHWYVHPSVTGWNTDNLDCGDYEFEPTHWRPTIAPFADRVAGEAEPKTIAGLCDCCSSWFGDLEQNGESEWLCGPCRVEEPAPPAAVAEQTDGEATKCENCGEPADDQSADTREHLAETGEVFCDTCVEESRDAAEAYAIEDGEED